MSLTFVSVPLANGVTTVPLNNGAIGQMELALHATGASPSAGTLQVQGLNYSGSLVNIGGMSAINLATALAAGPIIGGDFGHFQSLVFTLTGVTGGSGNLTGAAIFQLVSAPDYAFAGFRAITTQGYTEANVKNGSQFETSFLSGSIAVGATIGTLFTTGAKTVIIKDRQVATTCTQAELHLYSGPTATTGAAIPIFNLTTLPGVPATTTVALNLAATITANGTEIAAPTYVIGSTGNGQTLFGTYATNGAQRVLTPNTTYLLTFKNTGSGAGIAAVYTTWYEGPPDLPRT